MSRTKRSIEKRSLTCSVRPLPSGLRDGGRAGVAGAHRRRPPHPPGGRGFLSDRPQRPRAPHPTSVPTTGTPAACASIRLTGVPSLSEVSTTTSLADTSGHVAAYAGPRAGAPASAPGRAACSSACSSPSPHDEEADVLPVGEPAGDAQEAVHALDRHQPRHERHHARIRGDPSSARTARRARPPPLGAPPTGTGRSRAGSSRCARGATPSRDELVPHLVRDRHQARTTVGEEALDGANRRDVRDEK